MRLCKRLVTLRFNPKSLSENGVKNDLPDSLKDQQIDSAAEIKDLNKKKYYTVKEPAKVYSHPSFSAPVLATLKIGSQVKLVDILDQWGKIVSNKNREAYLLLDNLE